MKNSSWVVTDSSDAFDVELDVRTEVPQLRLGKKYSATLVDLEEEDTIASFVFTASMIIFNL